MKTKITSSFLLKRNLSTETVVLVGLEFVSGKDKHPKKGGKTCLLLK